MNAWLRRLTRARKVRRPAHPASTLAASDFLLSIERLEERAVMATLTIDALNGNAVFTETGAETNNVTLAWDGTTLTLTDTAGITLAGAGAATFTTVNANTVTTTGGLLSLAFNLGANNDTFVANGIASNVAAPIQLDGGAGNDTSTINLGSTGSSGTLNVFDTGAAGADVLNVNGSDTATDTLTIANRSIVRGTESVTFNAYHLETLNVDGRGGNDALAIGGRNEFAFDNFSAFSTNPFVFAGNAGQGTNQGATQSQMRLLQGQNNQNSLAYYNTPFNFGAGTSFQTKFQYTSAPGNGNDGFTFFLKNGTPAIGGNGANVGYVGAGMANSAAIVFDIAPTLAAERLTLLTNGSATVVNQVVAPFELRTTMNVWIDYDATTSTLSVFLSTTNTKPAAAQFVSTINLFTTLGSPGANTIFFGFTGGTGGQNEIVFVNNWDLSLDNGTGHGGTMVRSYLAGNDNDSFAITSDHNRFTIDGGAGADTVAFTNLRAGVVTIANDTLLLTADVTTVATNSSAVINGTGALQLGAATRVFNIADSTSRHDLILDVPLHESAAGQGIGKSGNGSLRLNSGLSSYTGTTTVNAGQLWIGAAAPNGAVGALGNSTSSVVLGTGTASATFYVIATVNIGRSFTIGGTGGTREIGTRHFTGTVNFSGPITTNNLALNFSIDNPTELTSTAIVGGGTGNISKSGGSSLGIGAVNTFASSFTVNGGSVIARVDGAFGTAAGGVIVNNGSTLVLNSVNYATAENLTINGLGAGGFQGVLVATGGASTWAGNITTSATNNVHLAVAAGASLSLLGATFAINANRLYITNAGALEILGSITATAANTSLTKTGAGVLTLGSANTYQGDTTIGQGRLRVRADGGLGTATGNRTIVNNGATLEFDSSAGAFTYFLPELIDIMGLGDAGTAGAIRHVGDGVTFLGDIVLNGIATQAAIEVVSGDFLLGDGVTGGNIDLEFGQVVVNGAGNLIVNGVISGNGAAGFTAGGLEGRYFSTNGGANTFNETSPGSGVINLENQTPNFVAFTPLVDFGGGTEFFPQAPASNRGGSNGNPYGYLGVNTPFDQTMGLWLGYITLTAGDYQFFVRSDDEGSIWIDRDGDGVFNNTVYDGVNNGERIANKGGGGMANIPNPALTLNIPADGTFRIRLATREGGGGAGMQMQYDPDLGGAAAPIAVPSSWFIVAMTSNNALVKNGTGTLTLASANTYNAGTNLVGGTILVTNLSGSGTGTGAVAVGAGSVLGGTGFITGTITVAGAGTVDPGLTATTGVLTVANIVFNAGANFAAQIAGNAAGQFDRLVVTNSITVDASAVLQLTSTVVNPVDTFCLIDNQGGGGTSAFNLVEGATVTLDGEPFRVTYVHDFATDTPAAGNDLVLLRHAILGDFVWLDTDGDGIQDGGETGVANVTVNLRRTSDLVIVGTTTTDGTGFYSFNVDPVALAGDTFFVDFDFLSTGQAYQFTLANQGGDDTIDSDAVTIVDGTTFRTAAIAIAYRQTNSTIDAGLFILATIQGVKYDDTENNGIGGIDLARSGDTVRLFRDLNDNSILDDAETANVMTAVTTGAYAFSGLAPGRYFIQQDVPVGRVQTAPLAPAFYTVVVVSGQVVSGIDFYDYNPDPIAVVGGPYGIFEGDNLSVDGSGSSDSAGGTIGFAWDIDGDGFFNDAFTAMPTLTWAQLLALNVPINDNGSYTVALQVTDNEGKTAVDSVQLTVDNTAPTLPTVSVTPTINENGVVTLTGTINEPSPVDSFTLTIDWQDGTIEVINLAAGTTSFSFQHQYLDDNPTGTPSDVYAITLVLEDKDGGLGNGGASTTVVNVAPAVDLIVPGLVVPGQPVQFVGTFADIGTLDTHEISWNFGDGTITPFAPATSPSSAPIHVFATPGIYQVSVTVRDDDGGTTVRTVSVLVGLNGLGPDIWTPGGTAFYVGGTSGADKVTISLVRGTTIKIVVNGTSLGKYSGLTHVFVFGLAGDDKIRAKPNVRVPLVVDGGEGNDIIEGGRGHDFLFGGAGNDKIYGGIAGRDVLIGGTGRDVLKGTAMNGAALKGDEDLLIGGSLSYEDDLDQLCETWTDWTAPLPFATRVAQLRAKADGVHSGTVIDDGEVDQLFGGPKSDWLWYNVDQDRVRLVGRDQRN